VLGPNHLQITGLGKTNRSLLRERIAQVIRESVLQGALKPGEQLVEAALAKGLKVSRAPLREAFQLLERQGFVRIVPREGTYVVSLTPSEIAEIYVLRDALEPIAACGACRNLQPEDSQTLKGFLSAMRESADHDDYRRYNENELLFHQEIWRLGGNRRLDEVLKGICTPLFTFQILNSHPRKERLMQSLEAHEAIFQAIQNKQDMARLQAVVRAAIQGGVEVPPQLSSNDRRSGTRQLHSLGQPSASRHLKES
jgi:DNA-binding GntR family transcriptional regulator